MLVKEGGRYNTPLQEFIGVNETLLPREIINNPDDWLYYNSNSWEPIDLSTWTNYSAVNCGIALYLDVVYNHLYYVKIENLTTNLEQPTGCIVLSWYQVGGESDTPEWQEIYGLKSVYGDNGDNGGGESGGGSV